MKRKIKKFFITILFILALSNSLYFYLKLDEIHINDESFLNKLSCPLCYGEDMCSSLETNSKYPISLESEFLNTYFVQSLFNVKNVFKGIENYTNKKIILKKLAHDSELKEFDDNEHNCLLRIESEPCLSNLAIYNRTLLTKRIDFTSFQAFVNYLNIESMKCASQRLMNLTFKTDPEFSQNYFNKNLMILTTLKLNIEPIILRVKLHFFFNYKKITIV